MQDGLEVCVGRDVHLHPELPHAGSGRVAENESGRRARREELGPHAGLDRGGRRDHTPGIGPATSGLRGLALLARVQPVTRPAPPAPAFG